MGGDCLGTQACRSQSPRCLAVLVLLYRGWGGFGYYALDPPALVQGEGSLFAGESAFARLPSGSWVPRTSRQGDGIIGGLWSRLECSHGRFGASRVEWGFPTAIRRSGLCCVLPRFFRCFDSHSSLRCQAGDCGFDLRIYKSDRCIKGRVRGILVVAEGVLVT